MTAQPRPTTAALTAAQWRKSSYSAGGNECVEFARVGDEWAGVRDSKDLSLPPLRMPAGKWHFFTQAVRSGTL